MKPQLKAYCTSSRCDLKRTPKGMPKENVKGNDCPDCGHALFFFPENRRAKYFANGRLSGQYRLANREKP